MFSIYACESHLLRTEKPIQTSSVAGCPSVTGPVRGLSGASENRWGLISIDVSSVNQACSWGSVDM